MSWSRITLGDVVEIKHGYAFNGTSLLKLSPDRTNEIEKECSERLAPLIRILKQMKSKQQ